MPAASPSVTRASARAFDDEGAEQLAVRVSRLYYELGMTQRDIAAELGMPRARVIRVLSEARRSGLVTITINSPLLENVELADALAQRYALEIAEVCLSRAADELALAAQLGAAAAAPVARRLRDGQTIGVGWGVTLQAFAERFDPPTVHDVAVVALLGSLTRRSSVDRFEATTALAAKLDAECLYRPSPIVCDSAESRRIIVAQPVFREIDKRALGADLALVSIGGLDSATIREAGLVTEREFRSVRKAGAVGNFLGYYVDAAGAIVDHPINERIIGIEGETFARIPTRLMISAGDSKVRALRAVLERGLVTGLVTDQRTARALIG